MGKALVLERIHGLVLELVTKSSNIWWSIFTIVAYSLFGILGKVK
jgi:hypothetical protein